MKSDHVSLMMWWSSYSYTHPETVHHSCSVRKLNIFTTESTAGKVFCYLQPKAFLTDEDSYALIHGSIGALLAFCTSLLVLTCIWLFFTVLLPWS